MLRGSLVALVTPMDGAGAIDDAALGTLIDFHVDAGTDGLVIAGTTGESATLLRDEHVELIGRAVELSAGRIPVIAGTGSNATRQTLDLSLAVGRHDVAGYLLVTPYYNKPTQEGLRLHFKTIADEVEKPIILYNVPGRTAVDMLPGTVAELADHPRIVGIKEATGQVERVPRLRELCGPDFALYSGDDASSREFMLAGGDGVISVTANVVPTLMRAMCEAAVGGDAEGASALDTRMAALHRALFVESNPIPVKWALERMGLIGPGIRLPLTRLTEASAPPVLEALRAADVELPA